MSHKGQTSEASNHVGIFAGLPVGTNQASMEERKGIPHHMLGFLPPRTLGFSVVSYRDRTLQILEDIWRRGKLPILVGGTAYYVEAVLWDRLLSDAGEMPGPVDPLKDLPDELRDLSNKDLHAKLESLDPETASVTDPHNRRRLQRALQVFYQSGQSWAGQLRSLQSAQNPLRYPSSVVFWLKAEKEVLDDRLLKRIFVMQEQGLRNELEAFYDDHMEWYREATGSVKASLGEEGEGVGGCEKGLFQSIAMKEFLDYLSLPQAHRRSVKGQKRWEAGLKRLFVGTRSYARRQDRWVLNRLLTRSDRQLPPLFALDSSRAEDADKWSKDVEEPAKEIVQALLDQSPWPFPPTAVKEGELTPADKNRIQRCDICDRLLAGVNAFQQHLTGKDHRYHLRQRSLLSSLTPEERANEPSVAELKRLLALRKSQMSQLQPITTGAEKTAHPNNESGNCDDDELARLFDGTS